MEKIEHSQVDIRGLSIHIAHVGKGGKGTVVFLHGFPEIWYTWRHQMLAVADAGYRAIAPDCRGYGLSDLPKHADPAANATNNWKDLVDDLLAILDSFDIPKAFLVGKDFGAIPAYDFAVHHPDRVAGVVTMGIPFSPAGFDLASLPEGFYIHRWRESGGRAEADFGRFDVKTVIRNIYILFSRAEIPIAGQNQEIMDLVGPSTPLPPWFTEDDLEAYADLYRKSGFEFPLQIPYRSLHGMIHAENPKVEPPAMLIMGEKDYCLKFPGMDDYIRSGLVKSFVPGLEVVFVPEGSHFVHEQSPELVNGLIAAFLDKHA